MWCGGTVFRNMHASMLHAVREVLRPHHGGGPAQLRIRQPTSRPTAPDVSTSGDDNDLATTVWQVSRGKGAGNG